MTRIFVAAVACLLSIAPARADCDHFKWSVARELGWFSASPKALPAQGGAATPGAGFALTLAKGLSLPTPPEREPGKDTFAAVVSLPKLDAGRYQITLSDEAWIDVVENGERVKSNDFSGQKDCPGVRKTVRFDLTAGAATVEISNALVGELKFAVAPSP